MKYDAFDIENSVIKSLKVKAGMRLFAQYAVKLMKIYDANNLKCI